MISASGARSLVNRQPSGDKKTQLQSHKRQKNRAATAQGTTKNSECDRKILHDTEAMGRLILRLLCLFVAVRETLSCRDTVKRPASLLRCAATDCILRCDPCASSEERRVGKESGARGERQQ